MNSIGMWKGQKIEELTREELLEVVRFCGEELQQLREDRARWRDAADPLKYLMGGRKG